MQNGAKQRRVLVVEDEQDIADLVALHLRDEGFAVTLANDGHAGMREACGRDWDLVILDIRLPGPDGLSICRALRQNHDYVPILMLTSKTTELDRVLGLELGADDYVSKPFSVSELVARARAILRRVEALESRQLEASQKADEALIRVGNIAINTTTRMVRVEQQSIELTAREFDLLLHFARHPGRVFNRAQLLDSVWGYGHDGYEHTVNSHINRLRAKIEENSAAPKYIVTVWGVGYKLSAPQAVLS
jgi:DNA-binding response OmpR family regulator